MNLEEIKTPGYRDQLESFLCYLEEDKNYAEGSLSNCRRTLCIIDRYMCSNSISTYIPAVGESYLQAFLETHDPESSRSRSVRTMITRFNEFIEGKQFVIQHTYRPIELIPVEMKPAMLSYLNACRVSGNRAITIHGKETCLKKFLMRCHLNGCRSLTDLTATVVLDACISASNKDDWAIIKNFLIHICREGYVENDYSPLVPRYQRPTPIPTIYTPEEIMAVEGAVDRNTKKGVRDYAMLLLATRLGMRIGDIVSLTIRNLDFKEKRIRFVQQKTEEPIDLPLLPEVEEAISDYINNARMNSFEERIFLRVSAPHIPVTTSALRFALNEYFITAGVNIEGRKHGPHVFRSSLASSMINDGHSYESVRAVLGHTDPKAITHYAKLDTEKLRMCAIPVPPPSGKFKSFLKGGM